MARQGISTGALPNDGTGDTLLDGAVKINDNFVEVYDIIGDGTNTFVGIVTQITAGTNVSISTAYGSVEIGVTGGAGISTANIKSDTLVVAGVSTLGVVTGATYYGSGANLTGVLTPTGDGSDLTGIVTSITAGSNITISGSTGNVTINASAGSGSTANINADTLVVSGVSTLGVVTGATYYGSGANLTGVLTPTGSGVELTGIVTSITAGSNITVSGSTGNVTINGSSGDPLFSSVTVLAPFDNETNGATTWTTYGSTSPTWTANGGTISNAKTRWGGTTSLNVVAGNPATVPCSLGTNDWTIEEWVWIDQSTWNNFGAVLKNGLLSDTYDAFYAGPNGSFSNARFRISNSGVDLLTITGDCTWQDGEWNHVAICRAGDLYSMYVNGEKVGLGTESGRTFNSGNIAAEASGTTTGYVQDFRISVGVARYSTTYYAVPVAPFSTT